MQYQHAACVTVRPLLVNMGFVLGALLLVVPPSLAYAQPFRFTLVQPQLVAVDYGAMALADVDGDGDMDLVASGNTVTREPYEPTTFVAVSQADRVLPSGTLVHDYEVANIPAPVWHSDVAWLDYDMDGALDFIVTGTSSSGAIFEDLPHKGETRIFRNRRTQGFMDIGAQLIGIYGGVVAVGDFDNDGDQDLLLSGLTEPDMPVTRLYRNNAGAFVEQEAAFAQLAHGDAQWGDYDNDGDLDLILSGVSATGGFETRLYRNDMGDGFTEVDAGLPGYAFSALDWGDYDNDGDLDLVLSGAVVSITQFFSPEADIYRNDQGRFTRLEADLDAILHGSVGWGDYDGDGDLDLFLTGGQNVYNGRRGRAYENSQGVFTANLSIPGVSASSLSWGDYDGDNDLDVLATGSNRTLSPLVRLYRNDTRRINTPPTAPTDLRAEGGLGQVSLSWLPGTDGETPATGLTYNLRVGTAPGASNVMSAMASETGKRWTSGRGNIEHATNWELSLPTGDYYWSVQSVDHSFVGSPFAAEGSFTVSPGKGGISTGIDDVQPTEHVLHPGYPNPFRDGTTIRYALREAGPVTLTIYNILGSRVYSLVERVQPAGQHQAIWTGHDENGRQMGTGVYFVRMQAGGTTQVERLMIVR